MTKITSCRTTMAGFTLEGGRLTRLARAKRKGLGWRLCRGSMLIRGILLTIRDKGTVLCAITKGLRSKRT